MMRTYFSPSLLAAAMLFPVLSYAQPARESGAQHNAHGGQGGGQASSPRGEQAGQGTVQTATPAHAASEAAAPAFNPDTVVARVNGHEIHMRNLQESLQTMPAELRGLPVQMLYPMLLTQAIDREALLIEAQKQHLDRDPAVQKAMQRAQNEVLQNALLNKQVGPGISEDAIRARYDRDDKDKPGEKEVHARHILVTSEDQARKIIAEIKAGTSFEDLAKKVSKDPGAQNGGDLGWFKRGDMVPEFAQAAFALKPGEVTQTPVHTQFGWHVIKLEGERTAPPLTFEQAHDTIRQAMIQDYVRKAVAEARSGLKIEEFAPDGSKLPKPDAEDTVAKAAAPAVQPGDNVATPAAGKESSNSGVSHGAAGHP